jgi:hypothetical protein
MPLFIKLQVPKEGIVRQVQDILLAASEFLGLPDMKPSGRSKNGVLFCFAHSTPSNMNNLLPVAREALRRGILGGIVMGGNFRAELHEFVGAVPIVSTQTLVARLPVQVRVRNIARLGSEYRQILSALRRERPSLTSSLAARRAVILRQLASSIQFGSAFERLLDSWMPTCVISTSDFWPLEHQLCCQASRRRIPSIVIQHGTIGDFWWPFVADTYCMWGETHIQQMQELGVPIERMAATGMPATDGIFRGVREDAPRPSRDHSQPVCLILSHTHGRSIERDVFEKYKHFVAAAIKASPSVNWKVKLHPMENDSFYREMGSSIFDRLTFHPRTASLQETVTDADVVTTVYSTAGLEAMVLGRPLIVAPAIPSVQHLAPWPSLGGGTYADTLGGFSIQLNRLVSDGDYRAQQLEKQRSFLQRSFANQGHAAECVVDLLEQYSAAQPAPEVGQPCPALNTCHLEVVQ